MKTRLPQLALAALVALSAGCMTESYLRQGDAAYASGRPEEALQYYERVYRRSADYRNNPAFQSRMQHIRVEALVAQGQRELVSRRWDTALAKFSEALGLEPSFETAVRFAAEARRGAADEALDRACKAADRNQLAEASQQCERGLTYLPDHAGLLQARASLSPGGTGPEVQAGLTKAAQLMTDQRWREAQTELVAVLEPYPYHLAARSRLAAVRGKLGEVDRMLGVVQVQMRKGDLAGAEKQLAELLRLSPHNEEARALATTVGTQLGEARERLAAASEAERNGRPGLALQHLYAARERWPLGVTDREVERLQGMLRDIYPIRISWTADGPGAGLVRGGLLAKLGPGNDRGDESFALAVHVVPGAGRTEVVRTERLQHQYAVRQIQPNPELPELQRQADIRRHQEREIRRCYDDAVRDLQRAQHQGPPNDPNRASNIERLERRVRATGDDLRRAERESEWAWRRLRGAPPAVEVQSTVLWPYVRHTVQKTLDVSAVATMRYGGAEVVAPAQFSRSAMAEDTDIEGANPQVGLAEDRLSLPDDSALAASAGSALAEDIAAWGARVAHEAWARQLQASADELERQGRAGDAVEQRMAAAAYRAQSGE